MRFSSMKWVDGQRVAIVTSSIPRRQDMTLERVISIWLVAWVLVVILTVLSTSGRLPE